jgi:hypothetical protein
MVLFGANAATAELISIAPAQSALVDQESEAAQVAFQFSLDGLDSGENRRIDMAFLEWSLTGVSDAEDAVFAVYPVLATWSAAGDGAADVSVGESATSEWEITPADHDRGNGGFVRLDVTGLVAGWASGASANHGVVMATGTLSDQALAGQLGSARLVIYYGFGE